METVTFAWSMGNTWTALATDGYSYTIANVLDVSEGPYTGTLSSPQAFDVTVTGSGKDWHTSGQAEAVAFFKAAQQLDARQPMLMRHRHSLHRAQLLASCTYFHAHTFMHTLSCCRAVQGDRCRQEQVDHQQQRRPAIHWPCSG